VEKVRNVSYDPPSDKAARDDREGTADGERTEAADARPPAVTRSGEIGGKPPAASDRGSDAGWSLPPSFRRSRSDGEMRVVTDEAALRTDAPAASTAGAPGRDAAAEGPAPFGPRVSTANGWVPPPRPKGKRTPTPNPKRGGARVDVVERTREPAVIVAPDRAPAAGIPPAPSGAPSMEEAPRRTSRRPLPTGQKTEIVVAGYHPPGELDPRIILIREPDSSRAASFRVLRHRLAEKDDVRTIVVTSAISGEGKTTCALNLALALAESGRSRVLLVEANVRAPSLGAVLGFRPPECFLDQMTRHRDRPDAPWTVVETFYKTLHVLAVQPDRRDKPILDAPGYTLAMERLHDAGYDFIVIDTPPVLGHADVNLVEDLADGVVLATRAKLSTGRALKRAVDQLQPVEIFGVVLLDEPGK
jgi:Mrp family chromosome partitioning ATPase